MGAIAVLGLGPSISLFKPEDYELSIGVNDIWKFHKSEVIVCLDHARVFYPERIKTINNSKPQAFYSQIVGWDTRSDFKKINIIPGYPEKVCNIDGPDYQKSYCSPFVACQIAYKVYKADEIHIYGVDLLNHPHLDRKLCEKIKLHFQNLKTAFDLKGVKLIIYGDGILKCLNI